MSLEIVINKLKSAGVVQEKWMNPEHLMFSKAFNTYSDSELNVYFAWLKEQRSVVRFLESGKLTECYKDETGISKHAQFEQFKALASDLLYPMLKKSVERIKDFQQALYIVSFSDLLLEEPQDTVQDEVGYWLNQQLEKFRADVNAARSDQEIFNIFHNSLNTDFWSLLDGFNHRHYRLKAKWVEEFISIIKHKHASSRLVRNILMKAELLNLRDEHKAEIRRLEGLVRSKLVKFDDKKMPWKRLAIYFVVIAAVTFGVTWLINLEPEPYQSKVQEETSFMQLSKKERMEIDSIIDVYNHNSLKTIVQNEDDIYYQPPPTKLITLNENNQGLFWNYYRNWITHEKDQFAIKFNTDKNKHKLLPKTESLATKKGNYKGTFYNESKKCALVIVFDEMNPDYMYCKFVQPKERVTFTVNTDVEKLVVVPGGEINPKLSEKAMPFTEFDEHFFRQLDRIYSVSDVGEPFKLVFKDMGVNGVVLIDLKKSLSL